MVTPPQALLVLMADSQPLFRQRLRQRQPRQERFHQHSLPQGEAGSSVYDLCLTRRKCLGRVAYIGVSNGDEPEFYELFCASLETVPHTECRHIVHSAVDAGAKTFACDPAAMDYLAAADTVFLAGGDPGLGWRAMVSSGVVAVVQTLLQSPTVLMGLSAGAMQLGRALEASGYPEKWSHESGFNAVPYIVAVHDETQQWSSLTERILLTQDEAGLGIPSGAAVAFERGEVLFVQRFPTVFFSVCEGKLQQRTLARTD